MKTQNKGEAMKKEMDVLKSLGISTSPQSLVHTEQNLIKSQDTQHTNSQRISKGMGSNPRDVLDGQLAKGGITISGPSYDYERQSPHAEEKDDSSWEKKEKSRKAKADEQYRKESRKKNDLEGTLKNTHGEEFHTDNDKQVEEMVSSSEEIDREFDGQTRPSKSRQPYDFNSKDPSDEKRYSFKSQRPKGQLTEDQLFLKAMASEGEGFVVEKSFKAPSAKPSKVAPHMAKDPMQKKQERAQVKEAMKADIDLVDWAKEEKEEHKKTKKAGRCWDGYKPAKGKKPFSDNSCVKKSDLDDVVDLVKGKFKEADIDPEILKNVHENSPGIIEKKNTAKPKIGVKLNNKFIKSNGIGGMMFDFGHLTGNPVADNATRILNENSDPVQASNANYQDQAYKQSLMEYTQKGDASHAKDTTMFGNLEKGWGDQLNKPMDQQVKEAYEKGLLDERSPMQNPNVAKSTAMVGGQQVHAQSETDAAVLEMFKAEQASMNNNSGGFVADASNGGRINVIAGLPLENQIPPHLQK